jgi:hypothetical protein
MKKIDFQKLSNDDLFGKLTRNKVSSMITSSLKGGEDSTSTALCKTTETWADEDSQHDKESLADGRCSGY